MFAKTILYFTLPKMIFINIRTIFSKYYVFFQSKNLNIILSKAYQRFPWHIFYKGNEFVIIYEIRANIKKRSRSFTIIY